MTCTYSSISPRITELHLCRGRGYIPPPSEPTVKSVLRLVRARSFRLLQGSLLTGRWVQGPGGAAAALPVLEVIQAVCEQAAAPMPPHSDLEGLLEQLVGTAATKGENGQGLGKLLVVFDLLLADRPAENAEMQAALLGQASLRLVPSGCADGIGLRLLTSTVGSLRRLCRSFWGC